MEKRPLPTISTIAVSEDSSVSPSSSSLASCASSRIRPGQQDVSDTSPLNLKKTPIDASLEEDDIKVTSCAEAERLATLSKKSGLSTENEPSNASCSNCSFGADEFSPGSSERETDEEHLQRLQTPRQTWQLQVEEKQHFHCENHFPSPIRSLPCPKTPCKPATASSPLEALTEEVEKSPSHSPKVPEALLLDFHCQPAELPRPYQWKNTVPRT